MTQRIIEILLALLPLVLIIAASPWFRSRLRSPLSWRARALIECRKSLGKDGDGDTKAALQREIDDLAFQRLAHFSVPPARRRRLIALNATHPVAAAWPALKDWHSVIDTDGDSPRFSAAAHRRYLVWTPVYCFCVGSAIAFYILMSFYALPLIDLPPRTRAVGASVSLVFLLPWLVWVTMVPNPHHYRRLREAFQLSAPPAPASAVPESSPSPARSPLVQVGDIPRPTDSRRRRSAEE